MADLLTLASTDRVLEIGTGSGYAASVISRVASEVYTVERHKTLAQEAAARLGALGYDNVHVLHGDGTMGWPEHAPYDKISVSASTSKVPDALRDQLAVGGSLVAPVGPFFPEQTLVRERRTPTGDFIRDEIGKVRFVPLIGEGGWQ